MATPTLISPVIPAQSWEFGIRHAYPEGQMYGHKPDPTMATTDSNGYYCRPVIDEGTSSAFLADLVLAEQIPEDVIAGRLHINLASQGGEYGFAKPVIMGAARYKANPFTADHDLYESQVIGRQTNVLVTTDIANLSRYRSQGLVDQLLQEKIAHGLVFGAFMRSPQKIREAVITAEATRQTEVELGVGAGIASGILGIATLAELQPVSTNTTAASAIALCLAVSGLILGNTYRSTRRPTTELTDTMLEDILKFIHKDSSKVVGEHWKNLKKYKIAAPQLAQPNFIATASS